jgi:hypothetical protein
MEVRTTAAPPAVVGFQGESGGGSIPGMSGGWGGAGKLGAGPGA